MNWIYLAKNGVQWRSFVITIIETWGSLNGDFDQLSESQLLIEGLCCTTVIQRWTDTDVPFKRTMTQLWEVSSRRTVTDFSIDYWLLNDIVERMKRKCTVRVMRGHSRTHICEPDWRPWKWTAFVSFYTASWQVKFWKGESQRRHTLWPFGEWTLPTWRWMRGCPCLVLN